MKKRVGLLLLLVFVSMTGLSFAADPLTCWFSPGWKTKAIQAKAITQALSEKSGLAIRPRIAKSYPEVLTAFATDKPNLVYVGSFVQSIIAARKLGTPLAQNTNGTRLIIMAKSRLLAKVWCLTNKTPGNTLPAGFPNLIKNASVPRAWRMNGRCMMPR